MNVSVRLTMRTSMVMRWTFTYLRLRKHGLKLGSWWMLRATFVCQRLVSRLLLQLRTFWRLVTSLLRRTCSSIGARSCKSVVISAIVTSASICPLLLSSNRLSFGQESSSLVSYLDPIAAAKWWSTLKSKPATTQVKTNKCAWTTAG